MEQQSVEPLQDEDCGWTQLGPSLEGFNEFDEAGWSVSLASSNSTSDDGQVVVTVAVGAPLFFNALDRKGQVSVYRMRLSPDGNETWTLLGDPIEGDQPLDHTGHFLQTSLSLNGDTVAIGAYGNNNNTGLVRVHRWNGSAWNQMGQDLRGAAANEYFGDTVSISGNGNRIVVGSTPSSYRPDQELGQVRVFEYNPFFQNWTAMGSAIPGLFATKKDNLVDAVSLSSDGTTIASSTLSAENKTESVQVYSFSEQVKDWTQLGSDIAIVSSPDDDFRFGIPLQLSKDGRTIVVGVPGFDILGPNVGRVDVFSYKLEVDDWSPVGDSLYGSYFSDEFGWAGKYRKLFGVDAEDAT